MRELTLKNKKGKLKVTSDEIKQILETKADFEIIRDISDTVNQKNIFVYDCKLDPDIFDMALLEELISEIKLKDNSVNVSVRFEDIKYYIKELAEEVESDLEEIYFMEEVNCFFDIYSVDESQSDFKFVFLITFEKNDKTFWSLSEILGRRQLSGMSKFYN